MDENVVVGQAINNGTRLKSLCKKITLKIFRVIFYRIDQL